MSKQQVDNSKKARCECEETDCGEMGPVADTEKLLRAIYEDQVENGAPTVEAFRRDDLQHRGLSLLRAIQYSDTSELTSRCEASFNSGGERPVIGASMAVTSALRLIVDQSDERALCVIGDGAEGIPEHATAIQSIEFTRSELKRLRRLVMDEFSKVIPLSNIALD